MSTLLKFYYLSVTVDIPPAPHLQYSWARVFISIKQTKAVKAMSNTNLLADALMLFEYMGLSRALISLSLSFFML